MTEARSVRAEDSLASKYQLLEEALDLAPEHGLILEFGVASGETLRRIAARRLPATGFDSFEGLPDDWRAGFERGKFAQKLPEVGGATLEVGWFDDTLPRFLIQNEQSFAFVHLDADLYSSTQTIFREAENRFVPGTVLLFDEYFNYPTWEQHEHKAFVEFIQRTGHEFRYVAYNALHEQVLVQLTS
jgi:predicted O-methyltransferase YrrM